MSRKNRDRRVGSRKRGRPRNADRPDIDWSQIHDLLVYGEIRVEDGLPVVRWPSYRDLDTRNLASRTVVGVYATKNDIQKKRLEACDKFSDEELFEINRSAGRIWAPDLESLPDCLVRQTDGSFAPVGYVPPVRRTQSQLVSINDLPREEIARLLVHGEPVVEDGACTRRYPSQSELARRYNTYRQAIRRFWEDDNCEQRREDARLIYQRNLDQELVDLHVKHEVDQTKRQVSIIDRYVERFEANVDNLRVDNVVDFDRLVRLRQTLTGGVESRTETRSTVVTLQAVQTAHQKFLDHQQKHISQNAQPALPAELTGEVIETTTEEKTT